MMMISSTAAGGGGGGRIRSSTSSSAVSPSSVSYDYSFKILLIGDSGVGKSSLLLTFISGGHDSPFQCLSPTIGVDFKIKLLTIGGKRLKMTIWDTVYDVTRQETFTNLSELWAKEVELYSSNPDCIKILVGNKVDRVSSQFGRYNIQDTERVVTVEEGMALVQEHKCLFYECGAKSRENVQQCFKDLTVKILERPSLVEQGSIDVKETDFEPQAILSAKTKR